MDTFCLEFAQEGFQVLRLGDKKRFPRNLPGGCTTAFLVPESKKILSVDDSDDVVQISFIQWNPGMSFLDDLFDHLLDRVPAFDTGDLSPGNHNLSRDSAFQPKDTVNHLMFITVEDTFFLSGVDDGMDVLFGHSPRFYQGA